METIVLDDSGDDEAGVRESDDDEFQERALAGRPSAETLLAPKTQPLASKLEQQAADAAAMPPPQGFRLLPSERSRRQTS